MNDHQTAIAELKDLVKEFVDARQWNAFHSPKNLSMSLAIEAAELMEHFQWISTDASREICQDDNKQLAIAEELADVFCYGLALANVLDIDVSTTIREKMIKNQQKYPADQFRGRFE